MKPSSRSQFERCHACRCRAGLACVRDGARRGWSLIEVMVVLTVMGILISISAPSFRRAIEQSRADVAGANLRAIWSAQRLYWLDHRSYATELSELVSLGLVDPSITSSDTIYTYSIPAAEANTFVATAARTGSTRWSGDYSIDESGSLSGAIQASGEADISPGFQ